MKIEGIIEELEKREREHLDNVERANQVVRLCGKALQRLHASMFDDVDDILKRVKEHVVSLDPRVGLTALQEYTEICVVNSVLRRDRIPSPEDIGVPLEAYLLGLADSVGELKRAFLEALRRGKTDEAERIFVYMEDIYESLLPIRVSNSILPNFRRKLDVARSLVEGCRRDLVMIKG